ncbi:MAG: hypothetical protein RL885_12520 [Planctomycetota bacterium]
MNHENDPFEDFRRKRELREEAKKRDQQTRLAQLRFADDARSEYIDRHVHDEMQDFFDESSRKAAEFLREIHADHEEARETQIQDEAEDFLSVSRMQTESLLSNLSEEDLGAISCSLEPPLPETRPLDSAVTNDEHAAPGEASEPTIFGADDSLEDEAIEKVRDFSLQGEIRHQEIISAPNETGLFPAFALPEFDVGIEPDEPASARADAVSSEALADLQEENRLLAETVDQLQKRVEHLASLLIEKELVTSEEIESEVIPL